MGEYIDIQFDDEGTRIWKRVTAQNIGRPLAIVVDGVVLSAPYVNSAIEGGRAQITGAGLEQLYESLTAR